MKQNFLVVDYHLLPRDVAVEGPEKVTPLQVYDALNSPMPVLDPSKVAPINHLGMALPLEKVVKATA